MFFSWYNFLSISIYQVGFWNMVYVCYNAFFSSAYKLFMLSLTTLVYRI